MDAQKWYKSIVNRIKDTFDYRFETFILDVTENICRIMKNRDINRAKLAELLDISRPAVTRMLNGNPNFTLKRLLAVADALDHDLKLNLEEKKKYQIVKDDQCETELSFETATLDDKMYNNLQAKWQQKHREASGTDDFHPQMSGSIADNNLDANLT